MSDMKCPFCQQELEIVFEQAGHNLEEAYLLCNKCNLRAERKVWQELIRTRKDLSDKIGKLETELDRTRKALDVARHTIGWINQMIDEHTDKQAIKIKCEYALQKITALEQKD